MKEERRITRAEGGFISSGNVAPERVSSAVVALRPAQLEARRRRKLSQRVTERRGSLADSVWRENGGAGGGGRRIPVTMVQKYQRDKKVRSSRWVKLQRQDVMQLQR